MTEREYLKLAFSALAAVSSWLLKRSVSRMDALSKRQAAQDREIQKLKLAVTRLETSCGLEVSTFN